LHIITSLQIRVIHQNSLSRGKKGIANGDDVVNALFPLRENPDEIIEKLINKTIFVNQNSKSVVYLQYENK
jgi:hypothetical protein